MAQVYDTKGRFVVHRISKEEASYKLCKVRTLKAGKGAIPHIATHDGRTIRYPDPEVKVGALRHSGKTVTLHIIRPNSSKPGCHLICDGLQCLRTLKCWSSGL